MKIYVCSECGFESRKWLGKCSECQNWDSLKEFHLNKSKIPYSSNDNNDQPISLPEIEHCGEKRKKTGISEFDGVLGGGLVPGMVIIIGGEPGVGKSTLMLQVVDSFGKEKNKILYVSGEESKHQIKVRSHRLGVENKNIFLYCTNCLDSVIKETSVKDYSLLVIDSIQSIRLSSIENSSGSISQLKECTANIVRVAKTKNLPVFIIGHITKEGVIAGPKIIEHMVDTVLYFEGEMKNRYKILRAIKNRFGSINELGVFEMSGTGLKEVKNPSDIFISQHEQNIGVTTSCMLEGSRPFLVEVQALVSSASYGNAQRVALGLEQKKLSLLIAIVEKYLCINLKQSDIFVNFMGGVKTFDFTIDLAIIAAILSSLKNFNIPSDHIFLGEVGLNGEVRSSNLQQIRIKEALKMGYKKIFLNNENKKELTTDIKFISVKNVNELYGNFDFERRKK